MGKQRRHFWSRRSCFTGADEAEAERCTAPTKAGALALAHASALEAASVGAAVTGVGRASILVCGRQSINIGLCCFSRNSGASEPRVIATAEAGSRLNGHCRLRHEPTPRLNERLQFVLCKLHLCVVSNEPHNGPSAHGAGVPRQGLPLCGPGCRCHEAGAFARGQCVAVVKGVCESLGVRELWLVIS